MRVRFLFCVFVLLSSSQAFGGLLLSGVTLEGAIGVSGGQESYTFDAKAGDVVEVRMTHLGTNAFTCRPEIKASSGATVGTGLSSSVAEITARLSETGTYTIVAREFSDKTGAFAVSMLLINGQPSVGEEDGIGVIRNGQTVLGGIWTAGDLDAQVFYARMGDTVQIRMTGTGPDPFDAAPELWSPEGVKLASALSFSAAEITVTLTNMGFHTIVCKAAGDRLGPYSVSLIRCGEYPQFAADADLNVLRHGAMNFARIDAPGDLDAGTFAAAAGDHALIRMRRATSSTFDSVVELYAPSGKRVARADSFDFAEINTNLAETGIYTVIAKEFGTGVGPYTLSFESSGGITPFDVDGDGVGNEDELAAGTDPFNGDSKFVIDTEFSRAQNSMILRFPMRGQARYRIQYRDDLTSAFQDFPMVEVNERELSVPEGEPSLKEFPFYLFPSNQHRFYRVVRIE